jgi:hypothetical protein
MIHPIGVAYGLGLVKRRPTSFHARRVTFDEATFTGAAWFDGATFTGVRVLDVCFEV